MTGKRRTIYAVPGSGTNQPVGAPPSDLEVFLSAFSHETPACGDQCIFVRVTTLPVRYLVDLGKAKISVPTYTDVLGLEGCVKGQLTLIKQWWLGERDSTDKKFFITIAGQSLRNIFVLQYHPLHLQRNGSSRLPSGRLPILCRFLDLAALGSLLAQYGLWSSQADRRGPDPGDRQ